MSSILVKKAGIFTTIQDMGRDGYKDIGITSSGAMDRYSYNFLNKLLSNENNTNALEISFGSIELISNTQSYIAITGAICEFSINGISKQNWMVHKIGFGDIIKIGKILKGQKIYFGVKDGFLLDEELGSVSTTIKEKLGGIDGDRLTDGLNLACKTCENLAIKRVNKNHLPKFEDEITLRVILGYQEESFDSKEKNNFFKSTYEVTPQINKMGYKLKGEPISCDLDGIISEAISFGAIQIPKDGQPIILLNDRQTIGGYPKIGSVLAIDCYKLAQVKPSTRVEFKEITLDEAIKIQKEFINFFK